jgi:hypothetical protein
MIGLWYSLRRSPSSLRTIVRTADYKSQRVNKAGPNPWNGPSGELSTSS